MYVYNSMGIKLALSQFQYLESLVRINYQYGVTIMHLNNIKLISDEEPASYSKFCKSYQKTLQGLGQLQLVAVMGWTTNRAGPLEANLPFHSGPETEIR